MHGVRGGDVWGIGTHGVHGGVWEFFICLLCTDKEEKEREINGE